MRLENMSIALRPRSAAEATDLGLAMVQQWWGPVMKAWCAVYIPAALIINLLCWKMPLLAAIILWWLKPAFDRVVLHVLSGAVFGATPTLAQTRAALKQLWWKNGLFAALTYARINFARSFTLPVVQLEGGRGAAARKRRAVLAREGQGAAIWLTIVCVHLEVFMVFSVYILISLFTPGESIFDFNWKSLFNPENQRTQQYLSNAVGALVVTLLEPFYVAGGFAIYLNCRTAIEGWDVELAFKRMGARLAAKTPAFTSPSQRVRRVAMTLLVVGALAAVVPNEQTAYAQAPAEQTDEGGSCKLDDVTPAEDDDGKIDSDDPDTSTLQGTTPSTGARDAAKEVLKNKEFGEFEKSWRLKYVGPEWKREKPKQKAGDFKWLVHVIQFIADSARWIAWIAGSLLVLFLLYLIARHIGFNGWRRGSGHTPLDMLFGLDVRPESLPDDVPGTARQRLALGDTRGAVSLLYRGALVSLIQDGRIDIGRGDTELECVARVQRAYGGEVVKAGYFGRMVAVWQRVAYAREPVLAHDVTPLIDQWAAHFTVRRANEDNQAQPAVVTT